MKRFYIVIAFLLSISAAYSNQYKITDVDYNIKGITRKYVLDTKIPVDKNRIFKSEDELISYIDDYTQKLENTRTFESIEVDFIVDEQPVDFTTNAETENLESLYCVHLKVATKDSSHLLALPYGKTTPTGDSGQNIVVKFKIKDTNFLGSMETMGTDVNVEIETKEKGSTPDFKLGFNTEFYTPFKMGVIDCSWGNSFALSYTFGKHIPEWDIKTGLDFSMPFDKFSLKLSVNQYSINDLDYYQKEDSNGIYNDNIYFKESVDFSAPIEIQDIQNWGKIYYTPKLGFGYNWDFDGIRDEDLKGPVISANQTVSTSRVNWIGNFRNGISVSISTPFSYNFQTEEFVSGINGELSLYKAFKYAGIYSRSYAFANLSSIQDGGRENIGSRLRGIRYKQYFAESTGHSNWYATETPAAFVFNIDVPIHIFTFRFEDWPFIKDHQKLSKIMSIFDNEVQLSPFLDFALVHNRITNTNFHPTDGFYSGGLEVLVYPKKWKNYTVRASFGVDLGRKLPYFKKFVNQDWRDSGVSSYELTIDLSMFY